MKYIKMFESFNYLNEGVELSSSNYELPDFEEKKKELDALFPYGCIDSDHYEYFNCDSEEDLKDRKEWGEIDNDRINDAVKDAIETVFPESEGFEVDCSMYHGDEKCMVKVKKDENILTFDVEVDI